MAKGIIKDNPTSTSGRVMVVVGDANYPLVKRGALLKFIPEPGIPLVNNDVVEIRLGPDEWCGITRKLDAPKGIITIPSPDNRGGEVRITDADPNDFGVIAGEPIRFNFLNTSENTPSNNNGDIIQVIIDGSKSSTFVKVLEPAR